MPLLTETEAQTQAMLPVQQAPDSEINAPIEYSFQQKLGAAFRSQNVIGSAAQSLWASHQRNLINSPIDPNYNPLDDLKGYEEHAFSFLNSETPEETYQIKQRIDKERLDSSMLTGADGFMAQAAAGVVDPINFIPFVGTAAKGGRVAAVAGRTALAGGVSAAVSETALQALQETRTAEESAWNIAGGTIIAGVLGGASVLVRDALSDLAGRTKLEVTPPHPSEPDILAPRSIDASILRSVGAAAVERGDAELKGALGLEKLIKYASPLMRTVQSPNKETRLIAQDLVETPFYFKDNAEGGATPIAVETQIKMWNGPLAESVVRMDELYKDFKEKVGGMTKREFREEIGKAMRRDDMHQIPQVDAAAKFWRQKLFDPLKDAAIEARLLPEGVEVSTARSYLTRIYNTEKIAAQRDIFTERVSQWLKRTTAEVDDGELEAIAADIVDHILGTPEGRIGYAPVPMKRGPLKERVFNIPDSDIEDFLHSDIETVSRFYTRTMAPDVELASRFGDTKMTSQIHKINEGANAQIAAAKTEAERKAINDQRLADIRDIEAMRDRLRGTYGMPNDPNGFFVRAGRWLRNENYLSMLGSMTLSSLADLARPVMVHGMLSTLRDGIVPMVTNFKSFRLAANEAKLAGTALDMVLDSRALEIGDIGDVYGRHTRFERGTQYLVDKFGKIALMTPWNSSLKQFASVISQSNFLRGVVNGTDTEKLAQAGISPEVAEKIAAEFKKHGSKDSAWIANTQAWTDREAINSFRAAIVKDVDRTIVTPGAGDRPLWMSSETGKMIGQFRSFSLAATQRITLSALQQRDMAALNGALLSVGLGMMLYKIRSDLAKRPVSDDPAVWIREGVDRSGITGWLFEANNITEKVTGGRIGINRIAGGEVSSRYASRNAIGTLLGPSAGKVQDITTAATSAASGEMTENDVRAIRRLVPYQNLFYLRSLFDELEEGVSP